MSVNGSDNVRQTVSSQSSDQDEQSFPHSVFGSVFDLLIALDYGSSVKEETRTEYTTKEVTDSDCNQKGTTDSIELSLENKSTQPLKQIEQVKSHPVKKSKCLDTVLVENSTQHDLENVNTIRKKLGDILNTVKTPENEPSHSAHSFQPTKDLTHIEIMKRLLLRNTTQHLKNGELTENDSKPTVKKIEILPNDSTHLSDTEKQTCKDSYQLVNNEEPVKSESQNGVECDKLSFPLEVKDEPEIIVPDNLKHILESLQSSEMQWDDVPFFDDGPRNIIELEIIDPTKLRFKSTEATDSVTHGCSEGESILGVYGNATVTRCESWRKSYNLLRMDDDSSPNKMEESFVDLDMGCYSASDTASDEERLNDLTPSSSPDPGFDLTLCSRRSKDEPKNDNDSGCDVQTQSNSNQVLSMSDSRVLQVSLRRLEEEKWFGNSKLDDLKITGLPNCKEYFEDEPSKHKNLSNHALETLKKIKSKRRRLWTKRKKLYRCSLCRKMFLNEALRDKHNKEIKCLRMWRCNVCVGKFSNKERLEEHNLSKCDTLKVFECDCCGRKYILKKHLIDHITPVCKSKCAVCGLVFKTADSMSRHRQSHNKREFLCEFCGKIVVTAYRKTFDSHLLSHIPEGTFTCAECNNTFESLDTLKKHLPEHGMIVFSEEFSYHCSFCGKPFVKSECLKEHLATHTGEMPFACNMCGKKFGKRRNLKDHSKICQKVKLKIIVPVKPEIKDEKPKVCEKCFTAFESQESYSNHLCMEDLFNFQTGTIKVENEDDPPPIFVDEKPYVCETCGRAIEGLENMINHFEKCGRSSIIKQENDFKPFSKNKVSRLSSRCGKTFTTKWSIQRHAKTCSECSSLSNNVSLKNGIKAEKETKLHMCQVCGNRFSSPENLKMHLTFCNIKTTDNKIEQAVVKQENVDQVCQRCGVHFSSYANLRMHLRFCSRKRIVEKSTLNQRACPYCGKMFNQKYISRHRKICVKPFKVKQESSAENTESTQSNSESLHKFSIKIEENCTTDIESSSNFDQQRDNYQDTLIKKFESATEIAEESTLSGFENTNSPGKLEANGGEDFNELADLLVSGCLISSDSCNEFLNFKNNNNPKVVQSNEALIMAKTSHETSTTDSLECIRNSDLSNKNPVLKFKTLDQSKDATLNGCIKTEPLEDLVNHDIQNSLVCKICGKRFHLQRYFIKHLLLCKVKYQYTCSVCNSKFNSQNNLKKHMVVHSENYSEHPCKKCGKIFAHKRSLVKHNITCKLLSPVVGNDIQNYKTSSANISSSNLDEPKPNLEQRPSETVPQVCLICKRELSSLRNLRRHLRTVHKDVYLSSGLDQNVSSLTNPRKEVMVNEQKVDTTFNLTEQSSMIEEALLHKFGERDKSQENADSELRKQRSPDLPQPHEEVFSNSRLEQNFLGESSSDQNQNEKNVVVFSQSEKSSIVKEALFHKLEERAHNQDSGIRRSNIAKESQPHRCSGCGIRFYSKLNYKNHLEGNNCRGSLTCILCKHLAASSDLFFQHMLNHGVRIESMKFYCKSCGQLLEKSKRTVESHLLLHTGEKMFKCDKCTRSFTRKDGLTRHLVVHSNVRPYSCDVCQSSFLDRRSLKRHCQTVHKISESNHSSGLPTSSASTSESLDKSFEKNIEIGESQLKIFFEEKPEIKDLLEKNLEALENFEEEKLFTVQHEGNVVFYGSLEKPSSNQNHTNVNGFQSESPTIQNNTNFESCQSELLLAIDSISGGLDSQPVESELPLHQW